MQYQSALQPNFEKFSRSLTFCELLNALTPDPALTDEPHDFQIDIAQFQKRRRAGV